MQRLVSQHKSLQMDFEEFFFLYCVYLHTDANDHRHSRYKKRYYNELKRLQRQRRDRRIPRLALHHPQSSAWVQLLNSGNDQALITLTGLDFDTFKWLEGNFTQVYDNYSPFVSPDGRLVPLNKGRGRKRMMTGEDCLGLCLAWTRTRGAVYALQMIFGLTGTSVSAYLRFGRRILIKILQTDDYAKITIPSDEKIREYCNTIQQRHPALTNVWCTMDGLKLRLQAAGNNKIQGNFYNGWTHDHYVSAVFVFCPDGTIPICCYNVPGCVHDSKIAEWGNIYTKLESVYERTGSKCTVDSAFSLSNKPYLIKSSQGHPVEAQDLETYRQQRELNSQATSMRQAAEWGMRAIQSSFPRLKDRFIYEEFGERKIIMTMIILLYNLRARRVGINQIKNVYMPALNVDANAYFVDPLMET